MFLQLTSLRVHQGEGKRAPDKALLYQNDSLRSLQGFISTSGTGKTHLLSFTFAQRLGLPSAPPAKHPAPIRPSRPCRRSADLNRRADGCRRRASLAVSQPDGVFGSAAVRMLSPSDSGLSALPAPRRRMLKALSDLLARLVRRELRII